MNLKIYEKTKYNNIYKHRKNGTYAVDLSLGYNHFGKRIRTTKTGFSTEKEAKLFLNSQDEKNKSKNIIVNKVRFKDLLEEYFNWCIDFKKVKEETVRKKRNRFMHNMCPFFDEMIIVKISEQDIANWQKWIKAKNFTDETNRTLERQLSAYLNWLIKYKKIINYNPYQNVEKLKMAKKEIEYRTLDEMKKLWEYIKTDENYSKEIKLRIIAITKMLFFCGFRFGELIGLRIKDIDYDILNSTEIIDDEIAIHIRQTLYYGKNGYSIENGKTYNSLDVLFVGKNVFQSLFDYIKYMQKLGYIYSDDDYIFTNPDTNKVFSPETLRKQLNYFQEKANIPHTKFKDLRSSHGTFLLSTNHSIDEVKDRLRHTSSKTTEKYYATFYEKTKRNLANDIDKYAI